MPQQHEKPHLPGPPAKRLRQTKSRMEYALRHGSEAPSAVSSHLPSPGVTGSSSNHDTNTPPSRIAQPAESKDRPQLPARSFADRLFPPTKSETSTKTLIVTDKQKPKPDPRTTKPADIHEKVDGRRRHQCASTAKTPYVPALGDDEYGPEALKKQLTDYFIAKASDLHQAATQALDHTHQNLTKMLIAPDDGEKSTFRFMIAPLARPTDSLKIRYRVQTPSGGTETRSETVGELVARADKSHKDFMNNMERIWNEFLHLGVEIAEVTDRKSVGGDANPCSTASNDKEDEEQEEAEKKALEKEIAEAEEEIGLITEAAIACAMEIEKEHRKATLPDLHQYYRSINMF